MGKRKKVEGLWTRNKYLVLSVSQKEYRAITKAMAQGLSYDTCWDWLVKATSTPGEKGEVVNAYLHLWGYFKKKATGEEKDRFFTVLKDYEEGRVQKDEIRTVIRQLLEKYPNEYLSQSSILYGDIPLKEMEDATMA